jgi:hypothetical protein
MITTKTTSIVIKTDDLKGSGTAEFDAATNLKVGTIKVTFNGGVLTFPSVLEYQTWLSQVVVPLTNALNSPSGLGIGFVPATVGVPGTDKVTD